MPPIMLTLVQAALKAWLDRGLDPYYLAACVHSGVEIDVWAVNDRWWASAIDIPVVAAVYR